MAVLKDLASKPYMGIMLTLVVLVIIFQSVNPSFLSALNITTMLRALSYPGIIAIGMGVCMISGIVDLSVGATAGFASVFLGMALVNWSVPLPLAIVMTLGIGGTIGLINAFVILKMRISPFIATISMMFVVRGAALAWNKGFLIYPLPEGVAELGSLQPLGVSVTFVLLLVVAVIMWYTLDFTVFGLEIRATGSDYEVAKVTEVRYILVHVVLLVVTGVLASVSGIMLSFVLNAGAPNVGYGWEFSAITACAIGGVSLMGYEGSVPGILLGLLVIQVIQNGLVMTGVSPFLQQVVIGAILLGAITIDVRRRKYLNLESL